MDNMDFSSIAFLFGGFIIGLLAMRWQMSLNPRQQFWSTVGGTALLICLIVGNGVYHWTAIPMAGALAYSIYRRYRAYAAYKIA